MKNFFFLLLLFQVIGHAQTAELNYDTNKLLLDSDFKLSEGRMLVSDLPCRISHLAVDDQFLVSVVCLSQIYKEFGLQKINDMILFANEKVRLSTTGNDYKPSEIKMSYNPFAKAWSMTNLFSVKDENGLTKESLLALDFDRNGNVLSMKKIF